MIESKKDYPDELIWVDDINSSFWVSFPERVHYDFELGYRCICNADCGRYTKGYIYEKTKEGFIEIKPKVGMAAFVNSYGYVKVFDGSNWVPGCTNKELDNTVKELSDKFSIYKNFTKKVVEALDTHLEGLANGKKIY
ncbi:MAG TPA: hypothetical protein VMX17_03445 [Candidatus Glassbacteria bacterium]|nr:hypothetical protein [Candidatus Glassbacteria bacterium]